MLKKFKRIAVAVLIAAVLSVPSGGFATIVRYVPFDTQCESAEIIALATVTSVESRWADGRKVILTEARLNIVESVKGSASGTVSVRLLGGTVGELSQSVAGTPSFKVGQTWVLFLEPSGAGDYRVVGFNQGCYPVIEQAGKKMVGASLAASETGAHVMGGGVAGSLNVSTTVESFLAQVKSRLNGEPAIKQQDREE